MSAMNSSKALLLAVAGRNVPRWFLSIRDDRPNGRGKEFFLSAGACEDFPAWEFVSAEGETRSREMTALAGRVRGFLERTLP
jgi:hypothetical protein